MSVQQPSRLGRPRPTYPRLKQLAAAAATALSLAFAAQANAAVTPGEHFTFNWLETAGGNPGLTGSVDLTVGAAKTGPYFAIAAFNVTQAGGFCGVCTPITEVLTGAQFDSATFGLLGEITGSFLGQGGTPHNFDLFLTDIPPGGTGTWQFFDTKDNTTSLSTGTYTPLVPVPEPGTIALLGLSLTGLALVLRRSRQ